MVVNNPIETPNRAVGDSDAMIVATNMTYAYWLNGHPSALSSFNEIEELAKKMKIVVFLDYDGVLSPIVPDPNSAFMSDEMRKAVLEVAKKFPTAIVSGRGRQKVSNFVRLEEVCYAGSHGMDIFVPGHKTHVKGEARQCQPALEFRPEIEEMLNELRIQTDKIPGAYVEDNVFSLSVHYRHVKDEDYQSLDETVRKIVSIHNQFHMRRGKKDQFHITNGLKVLEIRPNIKWNKGNALLYLLETLGLEKSVDVFPFYIGDDKTDEDAFKVLRERGQGCPIIVSSTTRDTMASYSLHDPSEVLTFLKSLANLYVGE